MPDWRPRSGTEGPVKGFACRTGVGAPAEHLPLSHRSSRSLVIAVISVGIGLAGLTPTFGIFLVSGQQQAQEQIRLVQEQTRLLPVGLVTRQ